MPLKTLESGALGLISINRPHTVKIFDEHTKFIEWRKTPLPLGEYVAYETKKGGGCGKVIGEFVVCDCIEYRSISEIPPVSIKMGQVSKEFLEKYANGKPLYANLLCAVQKYNKPKELSEFARFCEMCEIPFMGDPPCVNCYNNQRLAFPPQSWCRIADPKGVGR